MKACLTKDVYNLPYFKPSDLFLVLILSNLCFFFFCFSQYVILFFLSELFSYFMDHPTFLNHFLHEYISVIFLVMYLFS